MEGFINTDFPNEFGESPEDFLKMYSHLIYEAISGMTQGSKRIPKSPKLEVGDLSNGFFILISKDNFKKLRQYRGEGAPRNYIRKILRNHICGRLREERPKIEVQFELTGQSLEELKSEGVPEGIVKSLKKLAEEVYKSEGRFTNALMKIIGEEDAHAYKPLILSYAVFPKKFGESPNGFLKKYAPLIYKIIYEKTRYSPKLEVEDLFNGFYMHIREKNFKRLWQYRGEGEPKSYLTMILRNFIKSAFKKTIMREIKEIPIDEIDVPTELNHEDISIVADESGHESKVIKESLKETYSSLSRREKLIFKATYYKKWDSRKVANILGVRRGFVFETNQKVRGIFRKKLKDRGVDI